MRSSVRCSHFTAGAGVRSIIRIEVDRISDSCGFGVPHLRFEDDRTQLPAWTEKKGDAIETYRRQKNAVSIDDLPALQFAESETA